MTARLRSRRWLLSMAGSRWDGATEMRVADDEQAVLRRLVARPRSDRRDEPKRRSEILRRVDHDRPVGEERRLRGQYLARVAIGVLGLGKGRLVELGPIGGEDRPDALLGLAVERRAAAGFAERADIARDRRFGSPARPAAIRP